MEELIIAITNFTTYVGFMACMLALFALRHDKTDGLFIMLLCFAITFLSLIIIDLDIVTDRWSMQELQVFRRIPGRFIASVGVSYFVYNLVSDVHVHDRRLNNDL